MMNLVTDPTKTRNVKYKYLDIMGMIWLAFLIITTLTAMKTFDLGPFVFSVSVLFFPFTYLFADIFTEVYGYRETRKIVWTGLACLVLVCVIAHISSIIPPNVFFTQDEAFKTIFKGSPILAMATVVAFFAGEFSNSYALAKLKIITKGEKLWFRLVSSTAIGQGIDNTVWYLIAFFVGGFFALNQLPGLILSTVVFCTVWEFLAMPLTYKITAFLKKAEGLDIYDTNTDFNPFHLSEK